MCFHCLTPADLIALARRTAADHDRDPDALEITASLPDDLDMIPEYAAAGVRRVLVPVSPIAGLDTAVASPEDALGWRDTLQRYAET